MLNFKKIRSIFKKKPEISKKKGGVKKVIEPLARKIGMFAFTDKILKSFYISEKSQKLGAEKNQYVFKVSKDANKTEIKKAIESLYKITVLKVNIINLKRKQKNFRRIIGFKKGIKKAIVKVKKGEKIEL